jgi:hypothetical protein
VAAGQRLAALFVLLAADVRRLRGPAKLPAALRVTAWTAPGKVPVAATCMARTARRLVGPAARPVHDRAAGRRAAVHRAERRCAARALVLFSLGLGMGVPLLLLVTLGNRYLPRPGAWMNLVKGCSASCSWPWPAAPCAPAGRALAAGLAAPG